MIPDAIDDGQPEPAPARYRVRARGNAWEVCDTENAWASVDYFWALDFRNREPSDFLAAHAAAVDAADRRNGSDLRS